VGRTARAGQTGTALSLVAGMPIEIRTYLELQETEKIKTEMRDADRIRIRKVRMLSRVAF
jgi:superfamily II DNA/RNA helicase